MEVLEGLIYDLYQKNVRMCTNEEIYQALLVYTKNQIFERGYQNGKKKLYYISAEFLIGKLLSNNLINLGLYDDVDAFLKENGKSLAEIEEVEPEPSLGNGGLGRLAACFLDSIATLGLPGEGIGLNYHLGLFKQEFKDRLQQETPNPWIEEFSWLTPAGVSYTVPFRGFSLKSSLYDIDVAGYKNKAIPLHLFDIDIADESIVRDGISFDKKDILHNLTLFLYPDDSDDDGRKLRIYQQYFMVSNAAQFILDEAVKKGCNLHDLADYAVIQINDTHPSLIIPELIRLLTQKGIEFDEACTIVSSVCAYTNHTILAEALEKWPMDYLLDVVPHLVPIIEKLDEKIKEKYPQEEVAIIDKNDLVHMAHMDIHYGFSINGVAALHTEILKTSELKAFYDIYPEKFNNKTNGITFRRWLMHCNRPLTDFITGLIGEDFKQNADALENLLRYREDPEVLNKLLEIKEQAKISCKEFILKNTGMEIDENSIYDIQIKRLHEYKRQQLNALYIIHKYLEIKSGKIPQRPITFIFGAKAAPAYVTAKDIIHLLLTLQDLIKNDPEVSPYMKVVMI
ncbi:MAG: glycogen/starch/alpha-glucan family phosphorylase, partial [Clostridia bacterium]|nr:glycogen/starch/alpha-glucan family phosphorylase [Clostridia bacterium]MDY5554253.1 glycogen/starch/alpha-glucan family phosphorylase [Blautia sp.]